MVKRLHAAGIEVVLDVVYNHTGEGNQWGPTISFRGFDNSIYYRLDRRDRRGYIDFSGCGNCLETHSPVVLKLITDSLRYWVQEMHVDGFRFDLAPVLGRDHHHFNPLSALFQILHQDPVLSRVKLIAEPWDLGEHGYQLGNFPAPWREWNGKYRDSIRDFWRGEQAAKGEFAARICGSHDLFSHTHRSALASINFVTCHDGFSLHDLVSYNEKHNQANGEDNRDGEQHNRSWNCGVEGPTQDATILELRERQKRNFLTTLLLSHGVPMLRGGDEIGHTQQGNNNTYCQDNEVSWHAWNLDPLQLELLSFVTRLGRLRHQLIEQNLFVRSVWDLTSPPSEVSWIRRDGKPMSESDWHDGLPQIGVLFSARRDLHVADSSYRGLQVFLVFNAHNEPLVVHMPNNRGRRKWRIVLDTAQPRRRSTICQHDQYLADSRSCCVFTSGRLSWFRTL